MPFSANIYRRLTVEAWIPLRNRPTTGRQQTKNISLLSAAAMTHRVTMPIRPENRWLYPIDWSELSAVIRFGRAGARCEHCARPHLRWVAHLGDGRWWDAEANVWRSERGRVVRVRDRFILAAVRTTYVVLACAHLDHNPGNNAPSNLAALCQRCHMLHDAAEHRWLRWWNAFRRRTLRDLYEDPRDARARTRLTASKCFAPSSRTLVKLDSQV